MRYQGSITGKLPTRQALYPLWYFSNPRMTYVNSFHKDLISRLNTVPYLSTLSAARPESLLAQNPGPGMDNSQKKNSKFLLQFYNPSLSW